VSEPPKRASSTPAPFRPNRRGKLPSKDDWLTNEELRDRELAKVNAMKVDTNVKARKLAIMQEHRVLVEQANAITRNVRRRAEP